MAGIIYGLCTLTAVLCAVLLLQSYRRSRYELLLWSGLCFAGLSINNLLLVLDKVVFPVSIHDAAARAQSFGQVTNAFIRVVNAADNNELARYDLSEDYSTETALIFGELYRNGTEWKFRAVGQGYASGLAGIARDFGVNV